jgi:hypothetical protein
MDKKIFFTINIIFLLVLSSSSVFSFDVSGTVKDKNGNSIVDASVAIPGLDKITKTDSNGEFTFTFSEDKNNIQINVYKNPICPAKSFISSINPSANLDFAIDCGGCDPGTCNSTNGYKRCSQDRTWQTLDYDGYCQVCSQDPTCGLVDCSGSTSDNYCPIGCSSQVSSNFYYDVDCECKSDSKDGVCPVGCNENNDADCSLSTCGDGAISYPFETCESDSDCSQGTCNDCFCESNVAFCGDQKKNGNEECELFTTCNDGSVCGGDCTCGGLICENIDLEAWLYVSFDPVTKKASLEWEVPDYCLNVNYDIFMCEKTSDSKCLDHSTGFTSLKQNHQLTTFEKSSLNLNSEYCFFIDSENLFAHGKSEIECVTTGNPICLNKAEGTEFCYGSKRSVCYNNVIETLEDCSDNSYCYGPDRSGKTTCENTGYCDLCNGLFGMFSNLDIGFTISPINQKAYCNSDLHPENYISDCYFDKSETLFGSYNYCSQVISCYDYKSESSCTDTKDPCKKNSGCEWKFLNPLDEDLGGICRPKDPQLQKCDFCDEEEYNWLAPGCTQKVCDLFGESCQYKGVSISNPNSNICIDSTTEGSGKTCGDYDNFDDCTGGTQVTVNANYDSQDNRIGGTHQITALSQDAFSLGKCYWHAYSGGGGICLRNADGKEVDFTKNTGFDCQATYDRSCESDFESPETKIYTFNQLTGSKDLFNSEVLITYDVTDNVYGFNQIETYFCISENNNCYPKEVAQKQGFVGKYEKLVGSSGEYYIRYYSTDPAKNLEVIKSKKITVDTLPPLIRVISPSEEKFVTAEDSIELKLVTSLDTANILISADYFSEEISIDNCVLDSTKQPCIDNKGEFSITLPLTSQDSINKIYFDLRDFAGNEVDDWELSSIYKNETPPTKPNIIISEN